MTIFVIRTARRPCPTVRRSSAQRHRAARRSSIKSRSTSQYLSDDRRSLSVSSASTGLLPFMIFGRHSPERLLDGCDLRLDFDLPQLLCSFRAFPIKNSPSCIPLFGDSHYDLGAVVRIPTSRSYSSTGVKPANCFSDSENRSTTQTRRAGMIIWIRLSVLVLTPRCPEDFRRPERHFDFPGITHWWAQPSQVLRIERA